MDAKKFLQQIERIEVMIENKKYERDRWNEVAMGITAQVGGERVQSSGSKDKMAKAVSEAVDIQKQIDVLSETMEEVLSVIEQLDTKYYSFIHKMYIQHRTLREIANREGKSYTWATSTHSRALKEVQRILDRREKKQ